MISAFKSSFRFIPIFAALVLGQAFGPEIMGGGSCIEAQSVDLEVGYDKSLVYQVEIQIEHTGTVEIEFHDKEKQDQQFPIDVRGRLRFHERFIGSAAKPQAVRFYEEATAKMKIDQANLVSELSGANQLIVSRIKTDTGNKFQFASINDVLQQKELELIRNPADPLSLAGLFNQPKVSVGQSWEPSRDNLARFLGVDRVIYSQVKFELKEVDENSAKLHLVGKLKAEVDDTLTEMALAGVFQLDRKRRLVSGMRVTINEARRAGQIAPGFRGQTKINLSMAPGEEVPQLTPDALREIARTKTVRNVLKWAAESGSFELQYDPAWKMITSDNEAAILRFVEDGDLLTQCSIVRLPSRPADKPLLLADFQREVAKIIAKDPNSRIERAEEGTNLNGLNTLKVLVSGIEEEVPMHWLYYNVASADGRQVTFVFMLEKQLYSRVDQAAHRLVDGFAFNQAISKSKPDTLAPPAPSVGAANPRDARAVQENLR